MYAFPDILSIFILYKTSIAARITETKMYTGVFS